MVRLFTVARGRRRLRSSPASIPLVPGSGAARLRLRVSRRHCVRKESVRGVRLREKSLAGEIAGFCWRVPDVTVASPVPPSLADLRVPLVRFKRGSARALVWSWAGSAIWARLIALCCVWFFHLVFFIDLLLYALNLFEALYGRV